jgi:hypothetical protein
MSNRAALAQIGHNQPPDPFKAHELDIMDLVELADNSLSGGAIDSAGKAAALDQLLDSIKDAAKALEATRKAEAEYFDKGKAAVQAKAKPLATKLETAKSVVASVLAPWRLKEQEARESEQQRLHDEVVKAREAAREKFQTSAPTDIMERIDAEALLAEAKRQEIAANKLGRAATGLRTYWTATVTDFPTLLAHIRKTAPDALRAMLAEYAEKQKNAGVRVLPGVLIEQEKRVT